MDKKPKYVLSWEQKPREVQTWQRMYEYYYSAQKGLAALDNLPTGDSGFGPIEYRNAVLSLVVSIKG